MHHGSLHNASVSFDDAAEADDTWQRAVDDLDSPGFGPLLDLAAGRGLASRPAANSS